MSVLLVAAVLVSVFVPVVSIVIMAKMLQIAEDLRYLRSKQDSSVKHPMKYTTVLAWCLAVSAVLVGVLIAVLLPFLTTLNGGS